NCESIFERYEEARDVHDFHCKLLSRVTIDEINLLKSVIQKDEELAKYSTWNKIATVILGISENTIHAWRRFDGIPSLQTSQTVKQLLNHPNLIIERIQFYENPFSERRQQC
ncbi:MAG: hypothetical protein QF535_06840, partial [Anaerolineales bacterium]|nr:hypothetical protein [Anaerolineales bacterium]